MKRDHKGNPNSKQVPIPFSKGDKATLIPFPHVFPGSIRFRLLF